MSDPIPAYCLPPTQLINEVYDAYIKNLNELDGENFDLTVGTNVEAMIYARSVVLATARYALERAENNANPLLAYETLPILEEEYGLTPGPLDNIATRQAALAARMLLPLGATYTNVTAALTLTLGADFLYYRRTKVGEAQIFPAVGGDSPGNFVHPQTVIKNFRLVENISSDLGFPNWTTILPLENDTAPLLIGDRLVVDPETLGLTERIEVLDVDGVTRIRTTFTKAHQHGRLVTTQPYPFWISSQRRVLVIVTRAAAEDGNKRQKINDLMHRMMRGTVSWDIVPDGDGTHTAQYTIGDSVLGRTLYAPILRTTYP